MVLSSLDGFFYPKSIAVVGASNDTSKIGGYIFSQIKSRKDIETYPINLKEDHIQGKKAYAKLTGVNKVIDLVVIVVPSAFVLQVIQDCIETNCKNIIIISAGFKETGEEGKLREDKLKELIVENNLNVIGPNCLGILNAEIGLNCSFAKEVPQAGGVAMISQSGAVVDAILDWSFDYKIGFSKVVSIGNMAGVDELKMLQYLKDDPKTTAILFYMETLEKGKLFAELLKETSKAKPVIIIKPGTSENAKKAIGSHTGSLAQDNKLVQTLLRESNAILVNNLNELYDVLIGLKSNYNDKSSTAIITNAGGVGVISTDILSETGFKLYEFNSLEKNKFLEFLPKEGSFNNPIDILGDATSKRYYDTLGEINLNPNIHNILVLLTPQIMTDSLNVAKAIVEIKKTSNKNIFSCFLGGKEIREGVEYLNENDFSNFKTPFDGLLAMEKLRQYKAFNYSENIKEYNFAKDKIEKVKEKLEEEKGILDYKLTKEILEIFGIVMPHKKIMKTREDIEFALLEEGHNYVIKVDGKGLVHKIDIGGVKTGITKDNFKEEAMAMFERVRETTKDFTITLEREVKGTEVIVGLKNSDELGRFIMFGTGGTNVSVYNDVEFSTCPLSNERVKKLVESVKVSKLLKEHRGSASINFEELYEILIRMSNLQDIFPEIKEVDLNPIICNSEGIYLVDVKLLI